MARRKRHHPFVLYLLAAGAVVESAATGLQLTENELKQYDGTNAEKPIYLAVNGTIFDVSVSPTFYGPGGHYRKLIDRRVSVEDSLTITDHFTGRDASRAWVSQCWEGDDQLTWRMEGLEAMFMPRYLDEQMQHAADGESAVEDAAPFGQAELARMAKRVLKKYGKVSDEIAAERRRADSKAAEQSIRDSLSRWINFFTNSDKYEVIGTVIYDKDKPEPPALCEAALKKRPLKGGLLDDLMKRGKAVKGNDVGNRKSRGSPSVMPQTGEKASENSEGASEGTQDQVDDDEDLVKDEL